MMNGQSQSYIRAAIDGEMARLASARVGERNQTLFKSTAALASLGLREGKIIQHLRPVAEGIGLRGKELYSTIKSGVKAGHANPRTPPYDAFGDARAAVPDSKWFGPSSPSKEERSLPTFFPGGDDGPRISTDEIRRHFYRRGGRPVRIKIKRSGGFTNWYRVSRHGVDGWQAGKPDDYLPCPYVGGVDPFDAELVGDLLYWPEGEKDCDTLSNLGLPAFTFGGAGDGLPDGVVEYVRGRQVVILADNDQAGRSHALRKAMLAHGIAASIQVVDFAEMPAGSDVSDFLKINLIADLERRVADTPLWVPPDPPPPAPLLTRSRSLLTCSLSDVAAEKVEWLWPGRVAVGKLTMIGGEPGLGKSQLALAVAAAVTKGDSWPDTSERAPLGNVIILSAEDGLADTIRPRFDAAGGDASKVTVIRAVQNSEQGCNARQSFDLAADLALLEEEIARRQDTRLVLIDPVSSYLGRRVDSHKNADVRGVLEPLGEMAERLRVAILAITHLSKGDGKAINRFVGSIAFVAAARTAFAVVADPGDETGLRRLFLQVKNNIAPPQAGLAFRLAQQEVAPHVIGSAIAWDNSIEVNTTVDQALRACASGADGSAKEDAVEFLQELLSAGPMDVLDIEAEARTAAMLSESRRLKESKPFRAAAKELGVIKKRQGFGRGGRMQWSLPGQSAP